MKHAASLEAQVESLLLFLYGCPVGLVSFDATGHIDLVNPQAANFLAAGSGRLDNVVSALATGWPELSDVMVAAEFGMIVDDHRVVLGEPHARRVVAAGLVRLGADRWMMVLSDASRRVADELARRDGEERLRTVFDSIDEGFCLCEMVTDEHGTAVDYRFLEVNPLFSEMTGLADAAGRTALELVPDLEQVWIDTYARVGLGRETIRLEQGSDVMGRWFDVFAVPIQPMGHFAVVFRDQTERRKAEAATELAAAESTFRARLTDALRSLDEPTAIKVVAARILGEYLGASRVHYAEIEASGAYGVVRAEFCAPGMTTLIGRHRLDHYGHRLMDEFRRGRIVTVDDVAADDRLADSERAVTRALGIGAFIMVPVMRDGRVRSALIVHFAHSRSWADHEQAIVDECAERTLAAVDRARSHTAIRLKQQRSEAVTALITALEQAETPELQAELVVRSMVEILGDYATLEAPGDHDPILALHHRDHLLVDVLHRLRVLRIDSDAAYSVGRAAAGADQLLSPITPAMRAEFATSPLVAELLERLGPRSHMAVPVSIGGRRTGALMVGITDTARDLFVHDDLVFLRDTADRIGIVLTATALRRQEHHVAIRLQRALLPDELLWHPNVVIEAQYAAATADLEVGGDWYDTYRWDDGRIGLMVGDVVGHNLESAATMGRLRSAAAALAPQSSGSPAAMLDALDGFARSRHGTDFATAACFTIDPTTGHLTYSSAGHPPALVLAPDGTCSLLDGALSPPLCARSTQDQRTEASLRLEPNSLVVVYTDGLVERRRQPLHVGIAELRQAVAQAGHQRIDRLAEHLVEQLQRMPFEDDVVLACFRYTPVSDRFHERLAANGERLAVLRRGLRTWLSHRGVDAPSIADVLLVVSEAVTNAVEHAYRDRDLGEVTIDITDHDHHLTIDVTDHGRWRFTPAADHIGGRGLNIIDRVAHRHERSSTAEGTIVTMIVPTPGRQPAPGRPPILGARAETEERQTLRGS